MRLFIAIQLSEEMKAALLESMHSLKKLGVKGRYVPGQNLHLTLAFLGECPDAAPAKAVLEQLPYKPFRLSFSQAGTFGDLLWIGLKGNQGLSALVRDLRAGLDQAGIEYDRKAFRPHITIVREMGGPWQKLPPPKGEMMVKKVSLMRSEVRDGKRVYTELFSV
ncbi:MAG: RNA 2',3'-cyclic phosphodiesterase [Lachnospiraceae bacterium]|nr:RNA 2',3'-cyclic phosphodiesterase [Lachnospiraceae bacterium]